MEVADEKEDGVSETDARDDRDIVARRKTEAEREQIKLQAAYLNGIAIGLILVGGLSIPASLLVAGAVQVWIAMAIAFLCFCISPALHLLAKRSLKELDR